jgi:hypothetical protein
MKIRETIEEKMGRQYAQHLAQAMGATRDGLVWEILRQRMYRLMMPRRGRYQIWQGNKLKADRIRHRKEALAMIKMFRDTGD